MDILPVGVRSTATGFSIGIIVPVFAIAKHNLLSSSFLNFAILRAESHSIKGTRIAIALSHEDSCQRNRRDNRLNLLVSLIWACA